MKAWLFPALILLVSHGVLTAGGEDIATPYLNAVRQHADLALEHGRDTYGPKSTPLFADGLQRGSLEPVIWPMRGQKSYLSNFGSQQTFLRTLCGLSALTGDPQYKQAAKDATAYALQFLRADNGLGIWGGHAFYDLRTDGPVGMDGHGHELKSHYPYYQLFWEVNPVATEDYIEAMWGIHVKNWNTLSFNRHARFDRESTTDGWNHEFKDPEPFFTSWGLGFVTTGSDLIYAAAELYEFSGQEKPLLWAEHMARMFEKTRNADTGLCGIQYTLLPKEYHGGDRAQLQFGQEMGPGVTEGTVAALPAQLELYGDVGICYMQLGESLNSDFGRELMSRASRSLTAFAQYAYDPDKDLFYATVSDGRRILPEDIKRVGYYWDPDLELREIKMQPVPPNPTFFWAYSLAWRQTGEEAHWKMLGHLMKTFHLGELGGVGEKPKLNLTTDCLEPEVLLGFLELYRRGRDPSYLAMARCIGDNILAEDVHDGWILSGPHRANIQFDALEPLALLHLVGALKGRESEVPLAWATKADLHLNYASRGKIFDTVVLWDVDQPEG